MTGPVTELHSIMPIDNVSSIMKHGLLSHEQAAKLTHYSVAMTEIQDRRDKVQVPGGLKLHQYANLYFHARNPMMFKRREQARSLCVLRISAQILQLPGVILADQNASSSYVRFLSHAQIDLIDFERVFAEYWHYPDDQIASWRHKSIKCAEVLVPKRIDPEFVVGAYVAMEGGKKTLRDIGFNRSVSINRYLFFL